MKLCFPWLLNQCLECSLSEISVGMSLNAKYGLPGHGPLLLCLFIRFQTSQLHAFCTLMASWLGELWLITKGIITWFLTLLSLKMQERLAQQIEMLELQRILKVDL